MTLETADRRPARLTPQELLLSKLPGLLDLWEHDHGKDSVERRTSQDVVALWSGLQRLVLPVPPGDRLRQLDHLVGEAGGRFVTSILVHEFDCRSWLTTMEELDAAWDRGEEPPEELEWRTREA